MKVWITRDKGPTYEEGVVYVWKDKPDKTEDEVTKSIFYSGRKRGDFLASITIEFFGTLFPGAKIVLPKIGGCREVDM